METEAQPPRIEPEPEVYCYLCRMWLHGQTPWEDHRDGKKHRKTKRFERVHDCLNHLRLFKLASCSSAGILKSWETPSWRSAEQGPALPERLALIVTCLVRGCPRCTTAGHRRETAVGKRAHRHQASWYAQIYVDVKGPVQTRWRSWLERGRQPQGRKFEPSMPATLPCRPGVVVQPLENQSS